MRGEGYYRLSLAADLEVRGEDAATFLQSQFSQDILGGIGRSAFGLWLDYRGKILGESTLLHVGEDSFEIISPYTDGTLIAEHMDAHIIADDVEVTVRSGRTAIILLTEGKGLESIEVPEGKWIQWKGGYLFRLERKLENGWLWLGDSGAEAALIEDLKRSGLVELSEEAFELERIAACFPKIPQEVGPGETPGETGLIYGCSMSKGCYLGQEVVARMQRLGRARKMIKSVRTEGEPLMRGEALFRGDSAVGEIRGGRLSGAFWRGLASMKVADYEGERETYLRTEKGVKVRIET